MPLGNHCQMVSLDKQLEVHHLEGFWHLPDKRLKCIEDNWNRMKQYETSWKPFVVKSFKANGEFDRVDLRRWGKATESCEKAMRTMENLWGASLNVLSRLISWTLAEILTLDGVSDGAPSTWWTMKTRKDTSWHIVTLTHGFVLHSHVMWIWSESRIRCSVNRAFDPIYWPAPSQEFNQYTRYTYSCQCEQLPTGLRPKGAKTILMGPASSRFLLFTLLLVHVCTCIIYHMDMCGTLIRSAQSGKIWQPKLARSLL